jgi:hypothetical protein
MRISNKAWLTCLCASAVLLFVSIGYGQQGTPDSAKAPAKNVKEKVPGESELDKAPLKVRSKSNPLVNDPDAAAAGRKLFGMHCTECHGESAEGTHRAPSLRDSEVQDAPPGAIFWVLTNGNVWHGMPVWSKLPEPQRWQLVTYIKSLGSQSRSSTSH